MIRSDGEWLFHDAAKTGDWQSAAIALRKDVARLAAEKAELVQALEDAWTHADPAAAPIMIWTSGKEVDALLDFLPEAQGLPVV